MALQIYFADLTHTGQVVAANTFPYGVSLVTSYAIKRFGDKINCQLFKYPERLSIALRESLPDVMCFSNYIWNTRLAYAYASQIKLLKPETIIVFGGPNIAITTKEQKKFLEQHPAVDFYVLREGEVGFSELLETLFENNKSAETIRNARISISNTIYLSNNELIVGHDAPRIPDLSETPSPYTSGLLDSFFDDILTPLIETNRGCPFECTFCMIGDRYYNKVKRNNLKRLRDEITYISERAKTPDICITDSNFGMYREDIEFARILAAERKKSGWPTYVSNSSGKNQKDRVMEVARILDGAMIMTLSIQSSDPTVLENVKRKNIAMEKTYTLGKEAEQIGANSYSEIILGLPGDTVETHIKSVSDMIDAGINDVMTYQMMLLPGTESATQETREKFGLKSKWRVLPRCFGKYDLAGTEKDIYEIEEICVETDTLSFEQYLDCRLLSLTVEIFHNGGMFLEIERLLENHGIRPSLFVREVHNNFLETTGSLAICRENYIEENTAKLWDRGDSMLEALAAENLLTKYIDGELGSSELFKFKVEAIFSQIDELHSLAFAAARKLLNSKGEMTRDLSLYLDELHRYSLAKKASLTDTDVVHTDKFKFDFAALEKQTFKANPLDHKLPEARKFTIRHDTKQKQTIASYLAQYGTTKNGLGRFLLRSHVNKLYRKISPVMN